MLWASLLTLAALDTIGCPAAFFGMYIVIVIISVPVLKLFLCIKTGKQVRNRDLFRTSIRTVPTGSAGNQSLCAENLPYFYDSLLLFIRKRNKILHVTDIVLHHFHISHAGQHHHNTLKSSGKSDRITGVAAAMKRIQDFLCLFRQVY